MKVGIYVQTWHVGGVAAFCERLAMGLRRTGHAVTIVVATPFGKRDPAGRQAYQRLTSAAAIQVECLHLNAFHPNERGWRAADRIAALGCDALILSSHGPLAEAWARLCQGTPIIGVAHNDDDDTYAEFAHCEPYCDGYAAVSRTIYQKIHSLSRRTPSIELRHIPYGVPVGAPSGDWPQSPHPRVLVVSRLEQRQKRVLDLPLIWEEYRKLGGKATLSICGAGPEDTALSRGFAREISEGGVRLRGAVALDQMPAIYAEHDVLLSASAYEGFPISVLEATMHGLFPLLSRTRSGHPEIAEAAGAGRLCEVGDVTGFASALVEVTADLPGLRRLRPQIQTKARDLFGFDRMVTAYAELADQLCKARAGRKISLTNNRDLGRRPKVDFLRGLIRKWQYSRHYGWRH